MCALACGNHRFCEVSTGGQLRCKLGGRVRISFATACFAVSCLELFRRTAAEGVPYQETESLISLGENCFQMLDSIIFAYLIVGVVIPLHTKQGSRFEDCTTLHRF